MDFIVFIPKVDPTLPLLLVHFLSVSVSNFSTFISIEII